MICKLQTINKSPAIVRGFLLVTVFFFIQSAHGEAQQSQGYRFEQAVIRQFTGKEVLKNSYTGEWDIPAAYNTATGLPVSIKCIRWGNSVYLGDALRQRKIKEPFEMVVGFYEPDRAGGVARLQALHHLKINPERWRQWWGEISIQEIEELSSGIKKKPLTEAQAYARELAKTLRSKPGIIDLNPKVNKDQRRIQCSIPFDLFYREVLQQEVRIQDRLELSGKSFPMFFQLGVRSR